MISDTIRARIFLSFTCAFWINSL